MMNKLILLLLRKKLGVKKFEKFNFANQNNKNEVYYFGDEDLMKYNENPKLKSKPTKSKVSLKFLLSDECIVEKVRT